MAGTSTGAASRAVVMGVGGTAQSLTVERTVNELLKKAHAAGASDLHLEPNPDHLFVRARVDGGLQPFDRIGADQMKQVVARLKIMASLDPNEGRMPSEGRFPMGKFDLALKELDIRATFLPTFFGEKAVLRLVDHSKLKLSLDELGFTAENARLFQQILGRPAGLVLHVGPQGSGKTTTAYAALKNTPRPNASIVTVEETVEYVLPGVTQVEVDREKLTYVRALEAILHQDPDLILVAELPDAETARLAIEAANSGQLVISTVHATSAANAVTKIVDLGLPRPQVAHALAGVVSQRLVRRLCPDCREKIAPSTLIRSALSLPQNVQSVWKMNLKGCRKCANKGVRGRVGVFEVLVASDRIREAISAGASSHSVDAIAASEGTVQILRDAVEKICSGAVAVEEVLRTLCGVSVDDVAAITEPGEMVTFLKMVRDQFLPVPPAPPGTPIVVQAPAGGAPVQQVMVQAQPQPAPPPMPVAAPAPPPPTSQPVPRPEMTNRFAPPRPPSGSYPVMDEAPSPRLAPPPQPAPQLTNRYAPPQPAAPARPPSDRFRIPAGADPYRAPAPAAREASGPYPSRPAPAPEPGHPQQSEILRSFMQTLPPDVAASIARATGGPGPAPMSPPPMAAPPPVQGTTQRVNPNELLKQLQELQRRLARQNDSNPAR